MSGINHSESHFDVVVIGGGINGVGVAQAVAAAGYSVALLEKSAIAAGTSSKSSKLIHGGLRYLENFDFKLVRESLKERELLLQLAPTLVKRIPFFIPLYQQSSRSTLKIAAGLTLYRLLAGFHRKTGFRIVHQREWKQLDGLKLDGLKRVFQYWDAQTDDAALTGAVMRSAQQLGAQLHAPAKFLCAESLDHGYRISYREAGVIRQICAAVAVNAAGPWADAVTQRFKPPLPVIATQNVQGTHIEIDMQLSRGAYYLEAPTDRRAVFVIPWMGRTLIGTTETLYTGDPDDIYPLESEIDYLKSVFSHYFSVGNIEINAAWAGLRVLPAAETAAFTRTRESSIVADDAQQPHALTVFGGKITSYRVTAGKALQMCKQTLEKRSAIADTARLKLEV
jgi:glycerol-3-phosphate dehydrogenase